IYQLGAGANYGPDFHDTNDNSTNQYYHATTGYDNATGWGSFNGTGLFPDLVNGGPVTSAPITIYKIHAGPGTIGAFNSDNYYTGGSLYTVAQNVDTSAANAAPMAVYQTCRYGNFSYNMPGLTPGASYTVRLHFAETYFTTAGQRFFNVAINGATVLSNFDIATVAGGVNKALVEQFTATADSLGKITTTFTWQSNWPLVNGVEIIGASSNTAPPTPTNLNATAGNAQVSLSWTAATTAASYNIYRSLSSGSGYTLVGSSTNSTYLDTNVTNNTRYYYVVTAVNANGESPRSSQVSATPTTQTPVVKIHAGGGVIGAFNADNYYIGGGLYTVTQNIDTSAANAAPMAVYQSQRYGNFAYNMPGLTPGASYTVRLHFAESYFATPGQRYFNVAINGHTALANFDIATAAGGVNKAIVEQFNATADNGGNIFITFTWQTNWPLVNAVEIVH
ncbi:MAG: coagulation factor 5/8 type domain protein, partial [Chthonomonadaceae bacterium]|nr:coagulation factor 5/8 type domain protein [Chthonomonadaceae bacterium]